MPELSDEIYLSSFNIKYPKRRHNNSSKLLKTPVSISRADSDDEFVAALTNLKDIGITKKKMDEIVEARKNGGWSAKVIARTHLKDMDQRYAVGIVKRILNSIG